MPQHHSSCEVQCECAQLNGYTRSVTRPIIWHFMVAGVVIIALTLTPAIHGVAKKKRVRRHQPKIAERTHVPFRLDITPQSAPTVTVQCAVGAATTLVFPDEEPINIVSGLREQLGVQESNEKFAGRLLYLRPTMALAGITTNVIVETDHGHASFFVRTVFVPTGAGPGDFHGEVHIRTGGADTARKKLETQLAALGEQVGALKAGLRDAEVARLEAEQRAVAARNVGVDAGLTAALAGFSRMPLKLRKGRAVTIDGCRIRQLARLDHDGAVWLVYELRNGSKQPRRLEGVTVSAGERSRDTVSTGISRRTLMHAPSGDVLPGRSVRVAVYVQSVHALDRLIFNVSGRTIRASLLGE
ncbi:MAG: hypothetical protein H0W76_21320 [Pyrinomonadaceae bacterium]|nr:hypothetical protein [Pyrinomonadaceae bacterium]